jgi:hypothetical protein
MPLIMPEARYFSIPSAVVGGAERRKSARNCTPCVRSLDPTAARLHELAGANGRSVADDGDQIAMAARLYPQHAKAALLVVEGYALDRPVRFSQSG